MRYVYGIYDPHSEKGYALLNLIIARITENPQVIIIVSSIIINFGIMVFIFYNSKNSWLSVYLYITLYYYFFSFNYMRQFIAMAIVINSWYLLKRKRFKLYFIFLVLGTMFHTTAIIGILFLVIYINRKNIKIIPWIYGCTIILLLSMNVFIEYLFKFFPRYIWYSGDYLNKTGGVMIVVLYCSIFLITFLLKPQKLNEEYNMLLILASICSGLSILGYYYFIFVRPSLYFNIFSIIIIPELLQRFEKKSRLIASYVILALGFVYMMYYFSFNWHNILPYKVFF